MTATRPPLSRERILSVAHAHVEAHGHEALSVRKVAAELEVTAPALYDHVSSKADLLQGVAEIGYALLAESFGPSGERALDRCRARARAYVSFAERHPELFRVMFLYRPSVIAIEADNELHAATRAFESGLDDIAEAIADGDIAAQTPLQASLTIWAAVHGVASIALLAPALGAGIADDVIDAIFRGLRP